MADPWNDDAERRALGPQRSSARLIGLFVTLAVVVFAVVFLRRFVASNDASAARAAGKPFVNLQLEPLAGDGESFTAADLRGKVTLINFWGPWCPPCRMEFPELMELRERLAGETSFRFVSVTCMHDDNEGDLVAQTKSFLAGKKYDLPVHRDPQLITRQELLRLNESDGFGYPTTVLIDQQGIIRGVWVGYSPGIGDRMREQITGLLAAK